MLYFYDPQGQRVGKQQGNTLEDYVYDPQGHIISVHDGSGNLLRSELYTPQGRHVATWNSTLNTNQNIVGLFYNHADWLGTERVRTNSSATAFEWCTDTPYGMNLTCTPGDTSPMHFTGKQRDAETGLDDFGARYFGGGNNLGRFMTPDPSRLSAFIESPQTWNMYSYAYNNPLSLVDKNGAWPTPIHNQIIDAAFPNLTASQRQILKDVSADQDSLLHGGQGNASAFEHAMSSPKYSASEAEVLYNDFVSNNEGQATQTQINFWLGGNKGLSNDALKRFAAALHAITDSTSPAHRGFQLWDYRNPMLVKAHVAAESSITPQQLATAVSAARNAFSSTFTPFGFNEFDLLQLTFSQNPTPQVSSKICYYDASGKLICY